MSTRSEITPQGPAEALSRLHDRQVATLLACVADAVLLLNADLCITHASPAAERFLARADRPLRGAPFPRFLEPGSASRLATLVRGMALDAPDASQVWTTQDLMTVRADGTPCATDATLARIADRAGTAYVLVLGSAGIRGEIQRQAGFLAAGLLSFQYQAAEATADLALLGPSAIAEDLRLQVNRLAAGDACVLIRGELGTCRDQFAELLHRTSARSARAFLRFDGGQLEEGTLFGDPATTPRLPGRMPSILSLIAQGGTLFVDHIEALPAGDQSALARLVRNPPREMPGSPRHPRIDLRVIAGTEADLPALASEGRFRPDLAMELAKGALGLPPLRARPQDIPPLAQALADRLARKHHRHFEPLDQETVQRLTEYPWPGNLQELHLLLERAVLLSTPPRLVLHPVLAPACRSCGPDHDAPALGADQVVLTAGELLDLERKNLIRALEACDWRITGEHGAGRMLGISPRTVQARMKAFGLHPPGPSTASP